MPFKTFGCKKCGKQAPKDLRDHGTFKERMSWLRNHYKKNHPKSFKESVKKSARSKQENAPVDKSTVVIELLRHDIEGEHGAIKQYSAHINKIVDPKIKRKLTHIKEQEQHHVVEIKDLIKGMRK